MFAPATSSCYCIALLPTLSGQLDSTYYYHLCLCSCCSCCTTTASHTPRSLNTLQSIYPCWPPPRDPSITSCKSRAHSAQPSSQSPLPAYFDPKQISDLREADPTVIATVKTVSLCQSSIALRSSNHHARRITIDLHARLLVKVPLSSSLVPDYILLPLQ